MDPKSGGGERQRQKSGDLPKVWSGLRLRWQPKGNEIDTNNMKCTCPTPVEVCFVGVNNLTFVGRATFCSILKLSFDLICRYIVLYLLPKK